MAKFPVERVSAHAAGANITVVNVAVANVAGSMAQVAIREPDNYFFSTFCFFSKYVKVDPAVPAFSS